MPLLPAGDFRHLTPDQIVATAECQERDEAIRSAHEEYAAGEIDQATARSRVDLAERKFYRACERGLHYRI